MTENDMNGASLFSEQRVTAISTVRKGLNMPLYGVLLRGFTVNTTRSRVSDTDVVALGLRVGSQHFPVQTWSAGDVGQGHRVVNLVAGGGNFVNIPVADGTEAIAFSYQIFNGDASRVDLPSANDQLLDKAVAFTRQKVENGDPADYTTGPSDDKTYNGELNFSDTGWLQVLELVSLVNLLFPDCDGFVAADLVGTTAKRWNEIIASQGGQINSSIQEFSMSVRYPGGDSPIGCGSNSDYSVDWTVGRSVAALPGPHSLRRFLKVFNLSLQPGLRSLDPRAAPFSLRFLMQ
jgi:hypothetical protein